VPEVRYAAPVGEAVREPEQADCGPAPDWLPDLDGDDVNMAAADVDKATGNPVASPGGRSWTEARVSPSRVQGGAAPSVGDHGAQVDPMNRPGPSELAFRHPDLRRGNVNPVPLLGMRTDANPHPRDLSGAAGSRSL
jgi:hypothetical protein